MRTWAGKLRVVVLGLMIPGILLLLAAMSGHSQALGRVGLLLVSVAVGLSLMPLCLALLLRRRR